MIQKVTFPYPSDCRPTNTYLALIRGNIALYALENDGVISYIIRHIPTGKFFSEHFTKANAIQAFRDLSALHTWDYTLFSPHPIPGDILWEAKRTIIQYLDKECPPEDWQTMERIYLSLCRQKRRGKTISDATLERIKDEYDEVCSLRRLSN